MPPMWGEGTDPSRGRNMSDDNSMAVVVISRIVWE